MSNKAKTLYFDAHTFIIDHPVVTPCHPLKASNITIVPSVQPRVTVLSAALSATAAAATCMCRTSLYYCMYYALKYSLCLALFVCGCACHAA